MHLLPHLVESLGSRQDRIVKGLHLLIWYLSGSQRIYQWAITVLRHALALGGQGRMRTEPKTAVAQHCFRLEEGLKQVGHLKPTAWDSLVVSARASERNLPASARDTDWIPGLGRAHIPWGNEDCVPQLLSLCSRVHATQLLSLLAATAEAHVPRACTPQPEKSWQSEAPAPQLESSSCRLQLERARA